MSFKVAFIGAGSIGFTRNLIRDLLAVPEFNDLEIALMDISEQNLDMVRQLVERDVRENGLDSVKLTATTDQREAVTAARYVINVARVGGVDAFVHDIEIPLKYGIDQCVGDTLCAGGIMYGQRGIPMILNLCLDIQEVGEEECILLNYANPNAMMTWAANEFGGVYTLGLCHGVQGGHAQIAEALGIPKEELDIICAGINHQTWYIQLLHNGEDMTGKVLEAFENHEEYSRTEKVRIDMMRRFGYYSTESNGHLSEYVPWYRKRENEIKDWIATDCWIQGETGGYLRIITEGRNWFETDFPNWMKEPALEFKAEERSQEHGSYIIESLETGRFYRGHFNVVNGGCIANLPEDAIVEVPCYVDANGINIPIVGDLPMGCAAVCNVSINVQRLSVYAGVYGDDTLLRQAMMMDPLTGAVCNPPEIWQLVDDMLIAQSEWLPQFQDAIAEAKARQSSSDRIPTRDDYRGAVRFKTKTVEEMASDKDAIRKTAAASDKAGMTE
jgi:alpha-galactosidase